MAAPTVGTESARGEKTNKISMPFSQQLGLSQRISKARAPAQTQSTHHFEGKDEDAEKGESSQLLAQRKQREEEQWIEGENGVKAQGARFFFFLPDVNERGSRSIFSCPPPRFFFFLDLPPFGLFLRERDAPEQITIF